MAATPIASSPQIPDARINVIDPCLDTDLAGTYAGVNAVSVHVGRSLEMLPTVSGPFDAVLIDGDHNDYTVVRELRMIRDRRLLAQGGMILLHDVGDPWARREMFYEPDRMPAHAKAPDSPHGVLTAVETFVAERPQWILLRWRAEHGLACLVDSPPVFDALVLRARCFLWRSIRWWNRLLRLTGFKPADTIAWGKEQPSR